MQALLWFLLPVAAASGWWVAQLGYRKKAGSRARLNSAYGQGLNHLLNEEPDKATEVLVRMVEVDPDTVELHLALGSLFRRRGETDRAIRVHQNIIARSKLSETLLAQAKLELGRDYLSAGLLDRAESLLQALLDAGVSEKEVCQHLIEVYQQEKEWGKAVMVGKRLVKMDAQAWKPRVAQYHCELGDAALKSGQHDQALQAAETARREDPDCARAALLMGKIYQDKGDYRAAINCYQSLEKLNGGLLSEVMDDIKTCYTCLDDSSGWEDFRKVSMERGGYLLFAQKKLEDRQTTEQQPRYRCEECGFASRKLFWQCPGCQCWSSVKPIKIGNAI